MIYVEVAFCLVPPNRPTLDAQKNFVVLDLAPAYFYQLHLFHLLL